MRIDGKSKKSCAAGGSLGRLLEEGSKVWRTGQALSTKGIPDLVG